MKRALILGSLTALVACALVALSASDGGVNAAGTSADNFNIDAITTGNNPDGMSPDVLGTRDECREVAAGATFSIDLIATNIPAATPMAQGFAVYMTYDPAVISITGANAAGQLINFNPNSSGVAAGNEIQLPDTDGTWEGAAADTGVDAAESGSGVLERLTLNINAAAPNGGYLLRLWEMINAQTGVGSYTIDPANASHVPDASQNAWIAVGVTCASLGAAPSNLPLMGDVDCSGGLSAVDALKILRNNSSLSVAQTEPCTDIGYSTPKNGDVDCSGVVNAVDALKTLRHNASLPVQQIGPEPDACPDIGT